MAKKSAKNGLARGQKSSPNSAKKFGQNPYVENPYINWPKTILRKTVHDSPVGPMRGRIRRNSGVDFSAIPATDAGADSARRFRRNSSADFGADSVAASGGDAGAVPAAIPAAIPAALPADLQKNSKQFGCRAPFAARPRSIR